MNGSSVAPGGRTPVEPTRPSFSTTMQSATLECIGDIVVTMIEVWHPVPKLPDQVGDPLPALRVEPGGRLVVT